MKDLQRRIAIPIMALLLSGAAGGRAEAQEADAEGPPPPPSWLEGLELHGFVDLYWSWNENDPADHANFYPGYGLAAKREGELGVNLAALDLSRAPDPVGFHVIFAAGNEMELLKSGEPSGEATSQNAFRYLYQASISYATGWGRGLLAEGGLYPSHVGFEGALAKDNWSYTHSWACLTTPSYQTGIKLIYPFTDTLAGELHVVNGWQITGDNNDRPSFGTKLAWTPARGSLVFNTWYGPELAGNDDDVRSLVDLIATLKATERLELAFEGLAGRQERPTELGGGADEWTVLAGWARVTLSERVALALRAEHLEDDAGAISGFAQTLDEGTLTLEYRPRPRLALKLEGRFDRSDAEVFTTEGEDRARDQRLLVAAAILTF